MKSSEILPYRIKKNMCEVYMLYDEIHLWFRQIGLVSLGISMPENPILPIGYQENVRHGLSDTRRPFVAFFF